MPLHNVFWSALLWLVLQGRQRPYYDPDNGHVTMQLPDGVPVVIPMQAISGGAAAQASHQSMVLLLPSDALWG